jgi:tetratricopeptide (TPR) repeat protein
MLEVIPDQSESMKEAVRSATEAKQSADAGDWDGARAAMSRAIDSASDNATYHALMAWYTYQCSIQPAFERQRLAEHHLSVALEMDPENPQAHYYQGMMWANGGNTTRARIALSTALNLKPGFQDAAKALDKLNKPAEAPSKDQVQQPAFRRPGKTRLIVPLALATLLLGGGGAAALYVSGQPAGADDMAKQLGTHLTLVSTSRVGSGGQDLHIDVGDSWAKLPQGEQSGELQNIAKGAQAMGIVNVFLYSQSQPVAETHGDKICVGDCMPKITKTSSAGGIQRATLKAAGH